MAHYYQVGDAVLPSVTTLVHLISLDDRLMKWANYMGFKRTKIEEVQAKSSYFGNLVHSNLRSIIDPDAPEPMKAGDREYGSRLFNALCNFEELMMGIDYKTIATELTLKSTKLGYAGTVDWVATYDKDYVVLTDFKTSKNVEKTMYLQLGGYYGLLKEYGINVDYAQIIRVNEHEAKIHKLTLPELKQYHKTFLSIVQLYNDLNALIGPLYKPTDLIPDTDV